MKVLFGALVGIAMTVSCNLANAAEEVTVGMVSDPGYHAVMWAAMNGKVTDPDVKLKIDLMPIPAILQATMSQQYDLLPNGVLAIPTMVEQGLKARILSTVIRYRPNGVDPGIWVRSSGPIKTIQDLKGKSVAVQSVSTADVILRRVLLKELYGYNVATIGGDFNWVEIPVAQHEAALEAGRVDAAAFTNVKAYQIAQSPDYRLVMRGGPDLMKLYGAPWPAILLITYQEKIDKRPQAIASAARLLEKSAAYLRDHTSEVFADVAPKYKMNSADLEGWFREHAEMPFSLTEGDKQVMAKGWASAVAIGQLKAAPQSVDALIAPQAVMAK